MSLSSLREPRLSVEDVMADSVSDPGQEIMVASEAPAPALPRTPMDLLALALERGDDLSILEKLMDRLVRGIVRCGLIPIHED